LFLLRTIVVVITVFIALFKFLQLFGYPVTSV